MSLDLPGLQSIAYHFQKISSTTPDHQTLEKLIQHQQDLSHRLDLGQAFYMIIDYTDFSYQYVSDSFTEVLGYEVSLPLEKRMDFMRDTVHPDDAPSILALWEIISDHSQKIPIADLRRTTYTVDFRLRHADGRYCHILQQTIMLETDERGQFQYELIKLTDISHWQKQSPVMGILTTPNPRDKLIGIPAENIWLKGRLFSNAELRILEKLAQGKRSKEIAAQLTISEHTVDTHRRNMLRKTQCSNTQELIRMAYLIGTL